jgi:hypothetical protein
LTPAPERRCGAPHPRADRNALASLTEGKWDRVPKTFNPIVTQGLPDTMLADSWASLIAQFGQFESAQPRLCGLKDCIPSSTYRSHSKPATS